MSSFVNTMTSLSVKQGKLWRAGFIEEAIQAWISSCSREAFLKDHIVEWWLIISVSVEDGDVFDFRGMRLDWFRLQVCTQSHRKRPSHLSKHTFFVYLWAVKYSYCPYQRSDVLRFGSLILQVNLIEMDGSTLFFFLSSLLSFSGIHKCFKSQSWLGWSQGTGQNDEHYYFPHKDGGLSGGYAGGDIRPFYFLVRGTKLYSTCTLYACMKGKQCC